MIHDSRQAKVGLFQGFTLIETIIVISLIAFGYSVALPRLSIMTGSDVSTKLGRLAGDIRNAYDLAVLNGKIHRIVINFISGDYWLEVTEREDFYLGDDKIGHDLTEEEEKEQNATFEEKFAEYKDLAGETVKDPKTDAEIAPTSPVLEAKDRLKLPSWSKVDSMEWQNRTIGPVLIFQDLQAEHHGEKQTFEEFGEKARAFIYVFPSGYIEKTVIHIAYRKGDSGIDDSKAPYTYFVDPYMATTEIVSRYEEMDVHDEKSTKE